MSEKASPESSSLPAPVVGSEPGSARASSVSRAVALLAGGAIALLLLTSNVVPGFPLSIQPARLSEDGSAPAIRWHPCANKDLGDRYECATYEVPMDWAAEHKQDGDVVKLAVIKYKVEKGVKRLGSLFTNPGGPGGSGVQFVSLAGPSLNVLTGGGWDIISWDPRGVGQTEPTFRCFNSALEESLFIRSVPQMDGVPYNISANPHALEELQTQLKASIPYSRLLNKKCQLKNKHMARFVGTESVVRDLERMSSAVWRKGDVEKGVNFWGFSYGTIVGAYLTGIFPDRIGRVVIDGVVDPTVWQSGTEHAVLASTFRDTDKALENFVDHCLKAGHGRCALAENPLQSNEQLLQTLAGILDRLYKEPLLVESASPPGVVTSPLVSLLLLLNMYSPRAWPGLAQMLKEISLGDGESILALLNLLRPFVAEANEPASAQFAGNAVFCNDAKRTILPQNAATEELAALWVKGARHRLENVSSWFGWMGLWNSCDAWTIEEAGPGKFTGTFNQTLSNEFLMIGNSADPVTSVENAYFFQSIQPQSRVIHQDSAGHCSLALASLCTIKHLQTYLGTGELPRKNIFCSTDEVVFPALGMQAFGSNVDAAHEPTLEAARHVGETLRSFTQRA